MIEKKRSITARTRSNRNLQERPASAWAYELTPAGVKRTESHHLRP